MPELKPEKTIDLDSYNSKLKVRKGHNYDIDCDTLYENLYFATQVKSDDFDGFVYERFCNHSNKDLTNSRSDYKINTVNPENACNKDINNETVKQLLALGLYLKKFLRKPENLDSLTTEKKSEKLVEISGTPLGQETSNFTPKKPLSYACID